MTKKNAHLNAREEQLIEIPSSSGHLIVLAGFDTTGSHSAAVTTIISFVPGVKIAFIELYCSGLTKKQTFQLDAVEFLLPPPYRAIK